LDQKKNNLSDMFIIEVFNVRQNTFDMEQTEEILFNYLKEIVDQIEATRDGTKERYLQCMFFSKIINHKSNSHK